MGLNDLFPKTYQYYDTPDGQDIDKKLLVTAKYGLVTGLAISGMDILLYSHPKGLIQSLNRCAYFVLPITSMWVTYTAITYTATNLRGKDDLINSVLGGMAAGCIYGAWQKSGQATALASLFLGVAGAVKKHAIQNNLELIPEKVTKYGTHRTSWNDWSRYPEGKKGWTTGHD